MTRAPSIAAVEPTSSPATRAEEWIVTIGATLIGYLVASATLGWSASFVLDHYRAAARMLSGWGFAVALLIADGVRTSEDIDTRLRAAGGDPRGEELLAEQGVLLAGGSRPGWTVAILVLLAALSAAVGVWTIMLLIAQAGPWRARASYVTLGVLASAPLALLAAASGLTPPWMQIVAWASAIGVCSAFTWWGLSPAPESDVRGDGGADVPDPMYDVPPPPPPPPIRARTADEVLGTVQARLARVVAARADVDTPSPDGLIDLIAAATGLGESANALGRVALEAPEFASLARRLEQLSLATDGLERVVSGASGALALADIDAALAAVRADPALATLLAGNPAPA